MVDVDLSVLSQLAQKFQLISERVHDSLFIFCALDYYPRRHSVGRAFSRICLSVWSGYGYGLKYYVKVYI